MIYMKVIFSGMNRSVGTKYNLVPGGSTYFISGFDLMPYTTVG
jgi:hypothetical protein